MVSIAAPATSKNSSPRWKCSTAQQSTGRDKASRSGRSSAVRMAGMRGCRRCLRPDRIFILPGVSHGFKIPRSALGVIYPADLQVLMLERAGWPGFWQSVTGSIDHENEPLIETAAREVREETGIDASHYRLQDWEIENRFEIFKKYRSRYADGVTHNQEHVFSLELPAILPVRLEPTEHLRYEWLDRKSTSLNSSH